MIERLKSITLFILVAASLVQTYMLAYGKPYYEMADETEYIEPELIGTRAEADDLIYPKDIVLHLGEGQHVLLYPGNVFYDEIFEKVSMRSFGGFRQIERSTLDWVALREEQRGVEIRYQDPVPSSILDSVMQLEGLLPNERDSFDKIWITTNEHGDEVRTFFLHSQDNRVYEVTKADLTTKDVEQFVGFGDEYEPKYDSLTVGTGRRTIYVPQSDLEMVRISLYTEPFTPEQLQNNLFVNPGITRKLMERDGTEIYTDGKRGLQIYHDRQWMSYSDPIAPVQSTNDLDAHLLTAVQFVNQHGGWNGKFRIERYATLTEQEYVFRQYYGQYPIVDLHEQPFGLIRTVMNNGTVNLYERSMINLQSIVGEREVVTLHGGEQLIQLIEEQGTRLMITDLYPAYRPTIQEDQVVLTPVWVMELLNGNMEYMY